MIIFELPIVCANNIKEVEQAEAVGVDAELEEYTDNATFFLASRDNVILQPARNPEHTDMFINHDSQLRVIAVEYSIVREVIFDAIKKSEKTYE